LSSETKPFLIERKTKYLIYDIAIIGGGIAGASLAHFLGGQRSVLIIEREAFHGYHASGRSAAEFTRRFHAPLVGKLAEASAEFLMSPPDSFSETPLLIPRGNLLVTNEEKVGHLQQVFEQEFKSGLELVNQTVNQALERVPFLNPDYVKAAFFDPDCYDVEAETLLQNFVKSARKAGTEIKTSCELEIARHNGSAWQLDTNLGPFTAKVLVNASGAWADGVATLCGLKPLGITPYRRTVITVDLPDTIEAARLPEVNEIDEVWYFKPDAGRLLVSPADATPSEPCDAQPEELDVAYAMYYLEEATTLRPTAPAAKWAGLRSFSPDRLPVVGYDKAQPAFFWLAGQGGYGIQSSPALGQYSADLLMKQNISESLRTAGLSGKEFLPNRF
jgi:D-arginine dehydrogenase